MKKWLLVILGLALAGVGSYAGYAYLWKEETIVAAPIRTAQVTRGELTVTVSGSGSVSVVHKKDVTATEDGQLEALSVKVGDTVEKGQIIAAYEAPDLETDIEKLATSIAKQEMNFDQLKQKYIQAAEEDRDSIGYEIEALKLDIAANNQSLAELKQEQAKVVTVAATMSGKITELKVAEAGQKVQAGAAILTITDYSLLQSVIQVDELDVTKVKLGQKAAVLLDALEDLSIEGTVTGIADEGTSSGGVALFDVTIEFAAQEGIRIGMSASAEITVESKQDVLMVPIEAIREAGTQKMVLVASGDGAQSGGQAFPSGRQGTRDATGQSAGGQDRQQGGFAQGARPDENGASGEGSDSGEAAGEGSDSGPTGSTGQAAEQSQTGETGDAQEMQRPQGAQGDRTMPDGQPTRQSAGSGSDSAASSAAGGAMRIVTVGVSNETYIEIVEGLEAGESVVLPTIVAQSGEATMTGFPGTGGFGGGSGGGMPAGGSFGGGGMRSGTGGGMAQRGG